MVNECSGMITVLPPTAIEPVLVSCQWPVAGIPQGQDGIVAIPVKGGNAARTVHFNLKKVGAQCAVSASVSVPGDQMNHVYNVVVPAVACLGAAGTYSMLAEMVIEGAAAPMCTGTFFTGFVNVIGSKPGDTGWDPKYDLNKDNIVDLNDAKIIKNSCPTMCDYAKFSAAYRSKRGDANYDPTYDYNGDGAIDSLDWNIYIAICTA